MKNLELRIKNSELKVVNSAAIFSFLNSRFLICVAVFAFTALMAGNSRAEENLRFRFQPGDKYFLSLATEYKKVQAADGNEQASEQINRLGCDLDIEEVDVNGYAMARFAYRKSAIKVRMPGLSFDFDSGSGDIKIHTQAIPAKAVIGESFYIRITPQGRLVKITGLPAVISSAKSKIPVGFPERDAALE